MSSIRRIRARIYLETDAGAVIDSMFDTDLGNSIPEVLTGTLELMAEVTALSNFGSLIQTAVDSGVNKAMQRILTPEEANTASLPTSHA